MKEVNPQRISENPLVGGETTVKRYPVTLKLHVSLSWVVWQLFGRLYENW